MGRFITPLRVEQVSEATLTKNAVWRLTEPLIYESTKLGLIIADRGTLTDFASVPRWPLTFLFAGGRINAPAVLHDKLHEADHDTGRGVKVARIDADNLIFESTLDSFPDEGYSFKSIIKRQAAYLFGGITWVSVRLFGWAYWE